MHSPPSQLGALSLELHLTIGQLQLSFSLRINESLWGSLLLKHLAISLSSSSSLWLLLRLQRVPLDQPQQLLFVSKFCPLHIFVSQSCKALSGEKVIWVLSKIRLQFKLPLEDPNMVHTWCYSNEQVLYMRNKMRWRKTAHILPR